MIKIAVIIDSTRPGRVGESVARWVYGLARDRTDAEFELVDIATFDLPPNSNPIPATKNRCPRCLTSLLPGAAH